MKDVNFFVSSNFAELYAETDKKLYAFRVYPSGKFESYVNCSFVSVMPVTPKTKKLMSILDKTISLLIDVQKQQPPEKYDTYEKIKNLME